MTPAQRNNLDRLLKPRHIAFVGGRDAAIAIGEAHRIGFPGAVWPVNPKREEIGGHKCFASISALPEAPDAVFLAVPVAQAIETVQQLNRRGAGGIVCYTAGFGEAGTDGKHAERQLIEAAGDMALIGPNCYGVINYLSRTAMWPFAHGGSTPGYGAAVITQSGMLSSDLTMSQRSLPLTHMISMGNQAVVTIEKLVDHLCEQPEVRAIGLHVEGLRDVPAFAQACAKATRLGKPVVALKTGSSAIGKALTSSHTGSLSGEDDLYDALFDRCGVIRVHSPAALIETLKFACIAGVPGGNRMAGFTCSGGGATMLADHAEKVGLTFPAHQPATATTLRELLPPIATVSNPLDYTTPIWGQPDLTRPVFAAALADEFDAAVLVQDYPAPGLDESRPYYLADGDAFCDAVQAAGIPAAICSTLPENMDAATREHLIARGVAPMQGINETLDAISGLARWADIRKRLGNASPADLLHVTQVGVLSALSEATAKQRLAAAGIAVPDGVSCTSAGAARAAAQLGFPVALKMLGPKLLHKTEAGAVALGLACESDVSAAILKMQADVASYQPDAVTDDFLVERMQPAPLAELIVSIRRDAQFGLAMTLGSGGILTELVGDAATLLLPCSEDGIATTLKDLKVYRLLNGFRGRPEADANALSHQLLKLAAFMQNNREELVEIEINPMFVYRDSICAVDALIHVTAEG